MSCKKVVAIVFYWLAVEGSPKFPGSDLSQQSTGLTSFCISTLCIASRMNNFSCVYHINLLSLRVQPRGRSHDIAGSRSCVIQWLGTKVRFCNDGDETQLQGDTQALGVRSPRLWESPLSPVALRWLPPFSGCQSCGKLQLGSDFGSESTRNRRANGHGRALACWLHPDDIQCG